MKPSPKRLAELKAQIAELDKLIADGVLKGEQARQARDELERQMLAAVVGGGASAAPRPGRRLVAIVAGFVVVFGAAGYLWMGNRAGWAIGPGTPAAVQEQVAHSTDAAQIEAMIDKLAARLKEKPDDAEGWAMLGRSYTAQGRFADALPAYKKALALRPQDAQAMADYADALAMTNNRSLDGEPAKLIMQAVKIDPENVKALALAGTVAFNASDYRAAADYWERAVARSDPEGAFTKQIQGALAEARQRAGLPPAPGAQAAGAEPAQAAAAEPAQGAAVSGRVTLSAAAQGQVKPDDTVFVFARAANGPKMPLAILRKKVSDLPLDFRLDDSMAMNPALRLSSMPQVVVGARVSKSGTAMPGPGDWEGFSAPVAPGASGLRIEIAEPVR